jgi:NAD(P)-dependent dehydrogenase (short-subunit alcohol dehydrogenase family)
VITGGDSGIGRAVAIAFAREGADVLIAYLNENDDAQEVKALVEKEGRKAVLVAGDLSKPEHCRFVVEPAVDEFGAIDILVNNAAHQATFKEIAEISDEEWQTTFAVNIHAMFYLTKARCRSHEARQRGHQYRFSQFGHAKSHVTGLRDHQGRDPELHRRLGPNARRW